jgi:hypothetical protein
MAKRAVQARVMLFIMSKYCGSHLADRAVTSQFATGIIPQKMALNLRSSRIDSGS